MEYKIFKSRELKNSMTWHWGILVGLVVGIRQRLGLMFDGRALMCTRPVQWKHHAMVRQSKRYNWVGGQPIQYSKMLAEGHPRDSRKRTWEKWIDWPGNGPDTFTGIIASGRLISPFHLIYFVLKKKVASFETLHFMELGNDGVEEVLSQVPLTTKCFMLYSP